MIGKLGADVVILLLLVHSVMAGADAVKSVEPGKSAGTPSWLTADTGDAPEVNGSECLGKMELDYAECFDVYYYSGGYKVIDVPQSSEYLLVPEGAPVPGGAEEQFKILTEPFDHVYLAATSAMSLIDAIGCIDHITMTGTDTAGWNIQAPIEALESGRMIFAGRYSEPNYELLVGNGCELAIESTMIQHSPEGQEMLEDVDIPVFMDRSSYESTGLGRTEWIKAYGALFGEEDQAFEKFGEQKEVVSEMEGYEDTGKTIAYFSISTDGSCVVRRPDDYIAAMIVDAGGATVNITMEEFYDKAVNADYLVYNGIITGGVDGKKALLEKSELFSDFKAFQEGNLWQVDAGLYQSTDKVAQLIRDFHAILTGGDEDGLTFLQKIK